MLKEKNYSIFNLITFFFIGLLVAVCVFLSFSFYSLKKDVDQQHSDILNIVQAYNNLVQTLERQDVIKSQQPAQTR